MEGTYAAEGSGSGVVVANVIGILWNWSGVVGELGVLTAEGKYDAVVVTANSVVIWIAEVGDFPRRVSNGSVGLDHEYRACLDLEWMTCLGPCVGGLFQYCVGRLATRKVPLGWWVWLMRALCRCCSVDVPLECH